MTSRKKFEGEATATLHEPPANGYSEGQTEPKNRPAKSYSCSVGSGVYLEASVWPKEIEVEGKTITVYSVTIRKNYMANEGWKHTNFFRGSELSSARHLLDYCERWILDTRTNEEPEAPF